MAVQPFTQAIWGKPKLAVGFEVETINGNSSLICQIWNVPIKKGILKMLSVKRTQIDNLFAEFEILDRKHMNSITGIIKPKLKTQQGQLFEQIVLPASDSPASFPIVVFRKELNGAYIADKATNQVLPSHGIYIAKIKIDYEGKNEQALQEFVVLESLPYIGLGDRLIGGKLK